MRVVLLRVGIDSGSGGTHGPLFADGTFEFIPIPCAQTTVPRTYGNTVGRSGKPFVQFLPESRRRAMKDQAMHVDPEFETFTYGDPGAPKRGLRTLDAGDILVFYSGLHGWDGHVADPALYIVGHFEVTHAGLAPEFSDAETKELFAANAHVRDAAMYASQRDHLVLVKGGEGSRLLTKAAPISDMSINSAGQPLKVISREMRDVFGDFGGKVSLQRSPPRTVLESHTERAAAFVRGLR